MVGHGGSWTPASSAPFPFISALRNLHQEIETAPNPPLWGVSFSPFLQ